MDGSEIGPIGHWQEQEPTLLQGCEKKLPISYKASKNVKTTSNIWKAGLKKLDSHTKKCMYIVLCVNCGAQCQGRLPPTKHHVADSADGPEHYSQLHATLSVTGASPAERVIKTTDENDRANGLPPRAERGVESHYTDNHHQLLQACQLYETA